MIFLPPHAQATTDHGAEVHVFSTPRCELSEVRVAIPLLRESELDAAVASVLSNVVLRPTLSSQRLHRETLLRNGAEFGVSLMTDKLFISGICPPDKIAKCLSIVFQACVDVPTDAEFTRLLRAAQVHAQMLAEVPDIALHTENLRRHWGEHPFARRNATVHALQQLKRSYYATFVTERIGVVGAHFVVCANIPDRGKLLNDFTDGIADSIRNLPVHNLCQHPETEIPPVTPGTYQLAGDKPNAIVAMQLMTPASPRTASGHAAFRTAATILGGYPNSRLLTQLRDRFGLVYQVSSHTDDYRNAANLTVSLKTPLHSRQETVARFIEIIMNFIEYGPDQEEISEAVRYLINSTAVSWANPAGFSSVQATLLSTGATLNYWDELARDLAELNVDDVAQAARHYMAENVHILGST